MIVKDDGEHDGEDDGDDDENCWWVSSHKVL